MHVLFITVNLNDYNTAVKPPGKCRILTKKMPDSADEVPDTTGKVLDSADKVTDTTDKAPDNVQESYKYVLEKGFIVHYNS